VPGFPAEADPATELAQRGMSRPLNGYDE